jgi:uncharacterized membrane protein YhaH (DUF805 family)
MLYMKNVPAWERIARVMMGAVLLAAALFYVGLTTAGWALGAAGAMAALTGLFGFCPACAMVGRRLQG